MNNITKAARYECNHFQRLPEELIASIFDKIGDLKCLCFCSLCDMEYLETLDKFALKCIDSDDRQLNDLLDSLSLQHMKLPVFLDKLTKLQSIDMDYQYLGISSNSPSPMRMVKIYSDGSNIQSFVFLESRYMRKGTENESAEEADIEDIQIDATLRTSMAMQQFGIRYSEWICFMIMLAKCHASVQKVTITDSGVNLKMVVADELCVNNKPVVLDEILKLASCHAQSLSRFGWLPVLQLPSSGYIMKGVTLLVIDFPDKPCTRAKKLEERGFCDMDDELPVFREAVKEILTKHQDQLIQL